MSRSQGFVFVIIAVALAGGWRWTYANVLARSAFQRRALIVGAGVSGRALARALKYEGTGQAAAHGVSHQIVAFVDDNPALKQTAVEGVPILGNSHRLLELARSLQIDEVIVAITHTNAIRPELFEAILDCREKGIPVVTMATTYERLTGRVACEHVSRNVEVASGFDDNPLARLYELAKRVLDLAVSLAGLATLGVLIPCVAACNYLWSPGPLFFTQERVGKGGRNYRVIKFRSMVPEAEEGCSPKWAAEDDARVTRVGRLLRASHLDEIPQIVNVLRGEMSLVGPRPERPEFVARLSEEIPFYRARHAVFPGITGWAQIHQDYGDSVEMAKEKLEYDLYYLKHMSPVLDTTIVLRTIAKVVGFRGR
jgi:exopolysaccharide biosynthesis polyprenyl glycosylphosphotransferase